MENLNNIEQKYFNEMVDYLKKFELPYNGEVKKNCCHYVDILFNDQVDIISKFDSCFHSQMIKKIMLNSDYREISWERGLILEYDRYDNYCFPDKKIIDHFEWSNNEKKYIGTESYYDLVKLFDDNHTLRAYML